MALTECLVCQKNIPPQQRVLLKRHEEPLLTVRDILLRDGNRNEDLGRFCERYPMACRSGCHPLLKRAARLRKDLVNCEEQIERDIGQFFERQSSLLVVTSPSVTSPSTARSTNSAPRRLLFSKATPLQTTCRSINEDSVKESPSVFVSFFHVLNYIVLYSFTYR